ncbi:hypothetical protein [Clostridium botulinum]|nr:hypothetical protein [Clostridium botulinum]MBY6799531.1 hypothetical protein [Clostridium botulinum]
MLVEIVSNGINTSVKIDGVEHKLVKSIKFEHNANEVATLDVSSFVSE